MKKKIVGSVMAAAMTLNSLAVMPFTANAVDTVRYEAEDATIGGVGEVATEISGYSGTGYVNLTDNSGATLPSVTFNVNMAEAGNYGLTIGYATAYGSKPMEVKVNDKVVDSLTLEEASEFTTTTLKVPMNAGENTVTVTASWGWMQVDYIEIGEYAPPSRPAITASQTAPCDPNATDEAKALMAYLSSVYGEHILSGQQEIYAYGPHDFEYEFNYIYEKTGKYPAIRGFDYGNFVCPAFGSDDGTTKRILEWAAKGGIVTASFHLNVPTDMSSYTTGSRIGFEQTTYSEKTDFCPSKAIEDGTKENAYYTQALDALAEQFLILQEKGVPVLWRPLHEAEGNGGEEGSWFWWGREGSKVYRELYAYTYKYLTETKGCHNLIWEWNSYDYGTSANWYPGDAYVDIVGYDKYNCTKYVNDGTGNWVPQLEHNDSSIPDTFYSIMARYNNAKMVALMECDSFSTLENLTTEKAGWLYFMPWYDGGSDNINFLSNPIFNTEKDLIELYQSDYCITLDELPKLSDVEYDPEATNAPVNTEPTDPEAGHAIVGAKDADGNISITLPEAADTIYLVVELPEGATYANGGLGTSIEIDGKWYWANVQWEATKSGAIELNLADNLLNVTEGADPVEDEAIINTVKETLSTIKSFSGQIWSAKGGDASDVQITDAYIKVSGETDPTETTEPTSEPDTTDAPVSGIKGDVDNDGKRDVMDIILLNKALFGKADLNEEQIKNSDVDGDGKPTFSDSLMIMQAIVKLITLD